MQDKRALAPWIKRFLLEYLPADRNFARNTQHSYRDALRLFVIFASATLPKKPDELLVEDLAADLLRRFLCHIEERRKCSVATRNQRLAALRTLAVVPVQHWGPSRRTGPTDSRRSAIAWTT